MYNNYNPYFYQPQMQRQQPVDPVTQPINTQQYIQPIPINKPLGLLGKSVDSIEVVKATDIPLDGSICYFPLTDGSAIVTKQLKSDGTSKTIIYKPIEESSASTPTFITAEELDKKISEINFDDIEELKDEFKELKKELKELRTKIKSKGD